MKFGSACTFVNKPRGETPAPPPEKRTTASPRLPARPALSGQIGTCIFRTGRRQHLAFGVHVLSPGARFSVTARRFAPITKRGNRGKTPGNHAEAGARMSSAKLGTAGASGTPRRSPR